MADAGVTNTTWVEVFSRRQTVLNRCLLGMGVVILPLIAVWLRAMLRLPSTVKLSAVDPASQFPFVLLEIASIPALAVIAVFCLRVLLGWAVRAAPPEVRVRPKSRIWANLALSVILTAVAVVLIYRTGGPLGYKFFVSGMVYSVGQVSRSLLFGLVDFMAVAATASRSPGPPSAVRH